MQYFIFKHDKDRIGKARKNQYCLCQHEYGFQKQGIVYSNWLFLKKVKVGDIIILSSTTRSEENNKKSAYAWGYAIKARFKKKIKKISLNCNDVINTRKHGEKNKYRSDKYNGYIEFEDCECFYENLEDGKNRFGQRIDIDEWRDYNKESVKYRAYDKSYKFNTIQEINEEEALNIIRKLKNDPNFEFEDKSMENYIELLKSNKNLILTGAPGTGKTYLAKQIANEMIKEKANKNPNNIIRNYYEEYKNELEEYFNECERLRQEFIKKFPQETLKSISIEDYSVGRRDAEGKRLNNSFCYWVEFKLRNSGFFDCGTANSYLLYYDKNGELKNITKNKNDDELIKEIGEAIYKMATENEYNGDLKFKGDLTTIKFAMKIYNSYNPYYYFPIFSSDYMNNICEIFNIEKDKNPYKQNLNIKKYFETNFKDIKLVIIKEILIRNFDLKNGIVNKNNNEITLEGKIGFVQFHPSYDYTDFVEGLRPIQDEKDDIVFERKDGVFKEFCKEALNNQSSNFVFIIDEINRGEISKILGELFFSVDSGYRGKKGKVLTQYANLIEEGDEFKDGFYIPENVYIIGTMNDIDRSVESMDFAMRRRFAWKEIKAKDTQNMLDEYKWENQINGDIIQNAKEKMNRLNDAISNTPELSDAYNIGASYFLKLDNYYNGDENKAFEDLWKNHLKGLLFEYTRGMSNQKEIIDNLEKAYNLNNGSINDNNNNSNSN